MRQFVTIVDCWWRVETSLDSSLIYSIETQTTTPKGILECLLKWKKRYESFCIKNPKQEQRKLHFQKDSCSITWHNGGNQRHVINENDDDDDDVDDDDVYRYSTNVQPDERDAY